MEGLYWYQLGAGRADMTIELGPAERDIVTELLEKELEDMRSELHHTQVHGYREALKDREKLVRDLLEKMKG
jgi:hypothetical protein